MVYSPNFCSFVLFFSFSTPSSFRVVASFCVERDVSFILLCVLSSSAHNSCFVFCFCYFIFVAHRLRVVTAFFHYYGMKLKPRIRGKEAAIERKRVRKTKNRRCNSLDVALPMCSTSLRRIHWCTHRLIAAHNVSFDGNHRANRRFTFVL